METNEINTELDELFEDIKQKIQANDGNISEEDLGEVIQIMGSEEKASEFVKRAFEELGTIVPEYKNTASRSM